MGQVQTTDTRVMAVLGPTNTGKTHFAVERMLAHRSGMIGLPLRLLAREIYDRIVTLRGVDSVSLVTGEEKIGRDTAPYVVATVEAMPVDRPMAFLAIDEIQLCGDPERGHVFTDRLLRARGVYETMFMGSETIRPLLRRLVPEAEILTRPRFSTLSYAGPLKLSRLPRRCAVVAFTAADVYQIAETMRRQRGGAAVVMGALSPRTRNAQVAMYQAGEVDHLVATDAIGMGLNMDLGHVAFARLEKFDGQQWRRLLATEVSQIAGRAGRHMANGTFGTTDGCGEIDATIVEAVENHSFAPLKALRWRSAELEFRSVATLLSSLDGDPPAPGLLKVRDALDDRSLAMLAHRDEVKARAVGQTAVRLLWQVCQIPDFRKTLTDAHLHLLQTIYRHLTSPEGILPDDWVGRMVSRLDRMDGDIDTLVGRIAHIRTWTYVSHREEWLKDATHWQGKAREVEDRLSDALHERLTQRFVDRRASALARSMRENGELYAAVDAAGVVVVDGHLVGRLVGLTFTADAADGDIARKRLQTAARRALASALNRLVGELDAAEDATLTLDARNLIVWRGAAIARLTPGRTLLKPAIAMIASDELPPAAADVVRRRLQRWLENWLTRELGAMQRLAAAVERSDLAAAGRGIAFALVEGSGTCRRDAVDDLVKGLDRGARGTLAGLGVRFGIHYLYAAPLLRPQAISARARLLAVQAGDAHQEPRPGATVLRVSTLRAPLALGFVPFGELALRVDVVERLAAGLRRLVPDEQGLVTPPVELAAESGLRAEEMPAVLAGLGYRAAKPATGATLVQWRQPRRPRDRRPVATTSSNTREHSPFAVLARLKTGS